MPCHKEEPLTSRPRGRLESGSAALLAVVDASRTALAYTEACTAGKLPGCCIASGKWLIFQGSTQAVCQAGFAMVGTAALWAGPNGAGEMGIVGKAWNHMPMQMRHHIAQAGQVDLVRLHDCADGYFSTDYPVEQVCPVGWSEIAHFTHMLFPDDAAETGIAGFFNQQNPEQGIFVQQFAGRQGAKRTSHDQIAIFC